MTALAPDLERPPSLFDPADALAPVEPAPTLEDLIAGVWADVVAGRPTACPLCFGPLLPRFGAGPAPVGALCSSCGAQVG